jgi:flagellar basal body P-ring formation protein FlgA
MKSVLFVLSFLIGSTAVAEVIVPVRTIRAKEIIRAEDLVQKPADIDGTISNPAEIVGKEARVALYAGRPIKPGDVGPPAVVSRNDLITLVFSRGPLRISIEGRALGRGSVGETIRAMNMVSRMTVSGVVMSNGSVEVQ